MALMVTVSIWGGRMGVDEPWSVQWGKTLDGDAGALPVLCALAVG